MSCFVTLFLYTDFREILFKEAEFYNNGFKNLNDEQKLVFLFSDVNVFKNMCQNLQLDFRQAQKFLVL